MTSVSSVATISGNTITIVGAGTVTVTATQAETDNFTSGTISTTFTVNNATITSVSSVATIAANTITIVGAGTVNVTSTQAETDNFTSATITTTFTVNKATTTLANFTVPFKIFGDSSFNIVDPSSNRPGSFTYTSSNTSVATISENTINIVSGGNSVITATQESSENYNSASISATFRVRQARPFITSVEPGLNSVLVYFEPNNSGLEVLHYRYSLNSGDAIITNFTESPILISGLIIDRVYSVSLYSYTGEGLSFRSNIIAFKSGTPIAPIINSITFSNVDSTFIVNYTQSAETNGSPITKMVYTLNGRRLTVIPSVTNPIIIPNIVRGNVFNVQIASQNARGNSPLSNVVSAVIPVPPSRLTINSAELFLESNTTCYAVVNLRLPLVEGSSPITKFKYALNKNVDFLDLSNTSLPLVIPNLPVNQIFTIKLIATNLLGGDSPPSLPSKALRYILLPPGPPVIRNVTTSLNSMLVNFVKPKINGSEIITYTYSLNDEPFIDISSNVLPFSVPIQNNKQYNIRVKAVNLAGESVASTPLRRPVMFTYLPQ
jgi:hypothetical protein